jgi:hypothetical protein
MLKLKKLTLTNFENIVEEMYMYIQRAFNLATIIFSLFLSSSMILSKLSHLLKPKTKSYFVDLSLLEKNIATVLK